MIDDGEETPELCPYCGDPMLGGHQHRCGWPLPFMDRLAEAGVLDEAESVWDEVDAGRQPGDPAPVNEVIAEARRRRRQVRYNRTKGVRQHGSGSV